MGSGKILIFFLLGIAQPGCSATMSLYKQLPEHALLHHAKKNTKMRAFKALAKTFAGLCLAYSYHIVRGWCSPKQHATVINGLVVPKNDVVIPDGSAGNLNNQVGIHQYDFVGLELGRSLLKKREDSLINESDSDIMFALMRNPRLTLTESLYRVAVSGNKCYKKNETRTIALIRSLVQQCADVNAVLCDSEPLLHLMLKHVLSHEDFFLAMLNELIAQGINLNVLNSEGKTALELSESVRVIAALLKAGADHRKGYWKRGGESNVSSNHSLAVHIAEANDRMSSPSMEKGMFLLEYAMPNGTNRRHYLWSEELYSDDHRFLAICLSALCANKNGVRYPLGVSFIPSSRMIGSALVALREGAQINSTTNYRGNDIVGLNTTCNSFDIHPLSCAVLGGSKELVKFCVNFSSYKGHWQAYRLACIHGPDYAEIAQLILDHMTLRTHCLDVIRRILDIRYEPPCYWSEQEDVCGAVG